MYVFEKNPIAIEKESFRLIRQQTNLTGLSRDQQQVVMRIVHTLGLPDVANYVRFSDRSCESGKKALASGANILCDVEMVKQGITKRMISEDPKCFLNDSRTQSLAQELAETRTMAALEFWKPYLDGSVVLIANAPTALFKLLQIIDKTGLKPALVIGMPVGFVGAAESKQALWNDHKKLNIECITLLGSMGGSGVTAAAINALLRCIRSEYY